MKQAKLPAWLQHFVAAMGGGGIFAVAFLDSSVLSFPFITDALVIGLSIQRHLRMPYYAAMAILGSLAGCIWLYWLAKKGGEAFFHRRAGRHAERTKKWVKQNAFVTLCIASILPPPLPLFKITVLAEGVFQVRMSTFVMALLVGRSIRFFAEGFLAVRYGDAVLPFMLAHGWSFAAGGVAVLALFYVLGRAGMVPKPAEN